MAADAGGAPVVAVLNMKGGVGKTTITANVMRSLYRAYRQSCLLVDFDPQFNLSQLLLTQEQYDAFRGQGRTMLSVLEGNESPSLFKVTTTAAPPPPYDQVGARLRIMNDKSASLWMIPGDFGLVKYALIDESDKGLMSVRNRFKSFIQSTRESLGMVCIDCNPSSSFLTVSALEVATHVLVPVRPDRFSILGLELLYKFVSDLPTLTQRPKFIVLLNDIPRSNYDPVVEDSLRAHPVFGTKTLSTPLHRSNVLAASERHTGFASDKRGPHVGRAAANIEAVARELGLELGFKL